MNCFEIIYVHVYLITGFDWLRYNMFVICGFLIWLFLYVMVQIKMVSIQGKNGSQSYLLVTASSIA